MRGGRWKLCALLLLAGFQASFGAEIQSVDFVYREAASFQRISEYLSGAEAEERGPILRTRPEARSGLYFTMRLGSELNALTPGASLVLHLLSDQAKEPVIHRLEIPAGYASGSRDLLVGVTGEDWPTRRVRLLAAKIQLLGTADKVLSEWKSFAWEMP